MAKEEIIDLVPKAEKITDEQLKVVQEKVNQINQTQMQIGGLEVQKGIALEKLKIIQVELGAVQKELEEEYGKVSVNLNDGSLSELPEDEADKKN